MLLLSLDLSRSRGHKSAEKWQSGRMHTPAKGAGPNKGLEGSNPSFSANFTSFSLSNRRFHQFHKIPKSFKAPSSFFQKRLCCACTQRFKRVLTGNKKPAATQFVQRATRILERVKGVEPSSLAWKARVIAVIRHPQLRS